MTIKNNEITKEYDAWLKRLGKAIAAVRKELGITQNRAAIRCDVDMKYYQDVEYGRRKITTRSLFRLCKGLGVEMGDLIQASKEDSK